MAVAVMAGEGLPVRAAARALGVTESGYFTWRACPPSARSVRHSWLTELISVIHTASHGTYGYRRIHDELTLRQGIAVSHGTVELLMRRAGIQGDSGGTGLRTRGGVGAPAGGLPDEAGGRTPDALGVTEAEAFCAVVLDTCSRRPTGWSMGSGQAALARRRPSSAASPRDWMATGTTTP